MRRIISLLLSVLMIVSMCTFVSFGASAEEITIPTEPTLEKLDDKTGWTALSSASDFANMTATGKYYLTDNVTLTATIDLDFAGEFHGNGFTVTVSAPLFKSLSGATVSNLKIAGAINNAESQNESALSTCCATKVEQHKSKLPNRTFPFIILYLINIDCFI